MRIETPQHTVDRILDEVSVGDRIDVIEAHPLEHIAKQCEQSIGIGPVTVLGERCVDAEIEMPCYQTGHRADRYTGQECCAEQQSSAETRQAIVFVHGPQSAPILYGCKYHLFAHQRRPRPVRLREFHCWFATTARLGGALKLLMIALVRGWPPAKPLIACAMPPLPSLSGP